MMRMAAARRYGASEAWPGLGAVGVLVLAVLGYFALADLRVSAALVAAAALAAWAVLSQQHPRLALSASFLVVLIAGTKFRTRDAAASLDASLDLQIVVEIALFALVGVGVVAVWLVEETRRRLTKAEALILGYAAIAVLSTAWSVAPALTLVRATQLLILSALAILAVRVLAPPAVLWTACAAVAVYVLVCAGLAATFPWTAAAYYDEDSFRFAWFSIHPVEAGTLAAIGALGMLSASVGGPPRVARRVLGIPLPWYAMALVVVLVLTNSRGPLLAFVAGVGMLLLMRVQSSVRVAVVLITASAALIAIALAPDVRPWLASLANQDSAISRLLFRGQTADTVLELNGRLGLWGDLRPAIAAHALIGYGYQASRSVVLDAASWAAYAHNALLQTVLDLGIVGTSALVALVTIALLGAARSALTPWMRAAVGALMVFLVLNSISTESFAGAPGFEILLLFVCALSAASAGKDAPRVCRCYEGAGCP